MLRLSLSKLLIFGLSMAVSAVIAIGTFTIWQYNKTFELTTQLHEHSFEVVNNVRDIRVDVRTLWEITTKAVYQDTYPEDALQQIKNTENKIDTEYMVAKSHYLGAQSDLEEVRSSYEKLKSIIHETINIRNTQGAKSAAKYLEENRGEEIYRGVSKEINDVIAFAKNNASGISKESAKLHQNATKEIVLFSIFVIIFAIALAILLLRFIKKAIGTIGTIVEKIKNENYQISSPNSCRLADFTPLIEAIDKMAMAIVESKRLIENKNEEILAQNHSLMKQARALEELNTELDASFEEARQSNKMVEFERNRFSSILDFAPDGIHILDLDGRLIQYSHSFANMLGYKTGEMSGLCIENWEAKLSSEDIALAMQKLMHTPLVFETIFRKKDGTLINVEVNTKSIELDNKTYIYASARDITEKKDHEELKELLLEALGDGVYGIDIGGKCTFINNSALKMIGFSKEEVVGFNQHALFHNKRPNGTSYPESDCPIYKTVIDGEARCLEEVFINKNGEFFDVHLNIAPIIKYDTIVGAVVVFQDIRQQKELENNLLSINTYLHEMVDAETEKRLEKERLLIQQSKMATMGEMIGAIAHQWRQPLNSLAMIVQDVEMSYKFGELNDGCISRFKHDSMDTIQSMSNTIEDFRKFFSPNKKTEEFFIEDAISESLKMLESQLKMYGVEIEFDKNVANNHQHNGYKSELKQVLLNILANAKDALFEVKPEKPFIKIDVNTIDDKLVIAIEDSAGGIPENIIGRIFEPYFTTKDEDKGTGIGLYISKQIIEESLHGKLSVSNTNNGAKFIIELYNAHIGE